MRAYKLVIGDNKIVIESSPENPQGCHIQFNIQQFYEGETVNADVTVYNIAPYYFTANPVLVGQKIQLYAGMVDSPIMKKIGGTVSYGLIASGYISYVIPEWNGQTTALSILFQPAKTNGTETIGYPLQVKKGEDIRTKFSDIFSKVTDGSENIDLGQNPIISPAKADHMVYFLSDLDRFLKNLDLGRLYRAKDRYILSTLSNNNSPIKLKPGDFVFQPSMKDLATIVLTTQMRTDIQLGDIVNLPQNVYVGMVSIGVDTLALNNLFKGKTVFSMFSGNWQIIEIWQRGASRDPQARSWITELHGIKAS